MVEELNTADFQATVNEGLVLVDFWAPWCGPCQMQAPIVEEAAEEMQDVHFYKVNIDDNPEIAEQFSIMSIPTLMVIKDGEIKEVEVGVHNKTQIKELLEQYR